jgi:hypothetical protein
MCIRDVWLVDNSPLAQRPARDYYGYTVDVESFTQATLVPASNLIHSVVKVRNRFSAKGVPCTGYIIPERRAASSTR